MKVTYFSQYKQDKFLNEVVFSNKENGFFIDIGAHDGVSLSNSLFFEKYKNWEGICIEPNPKVFEKLANSRKSINLNVCIGDENRKIKFTQLEGDSEMLSGISDKYDDRHIQRINDEIVKNGGKITEIDVEMITLASIHELKDRKIDFISIDTEGNEYDIIKSIDFNLFDIKVLVIENNYSDVKIKNHLNSFGFEFVCKLDCDEVFINKKDLSNAIKNRIVVWKWKVKIKMKLKSISYRIKKMIELKKFNIRD